MGEVGCRDAVGRQKIRGNNFQPPISFPIDFACGTSTGNVENLQSRDSGSLQHHNCEPGTDIPDLDHRNTVLVRALRISCKSSSFNIIVTWSLKEWL